jgi:hypothetical protein
VSEGEETSANRGSARTILGGRERVIERPFELFGEIFHPPFQEAIKSFFMVHASEFAFLDGPILAKEKDVRMACIKGIVANARPNQNWLVIFLDLKRLFGDVPQLDERTAGAIMAEGAIPAGVREGASFHERSHSMSSGGAAIESSPTSSLRLTTKTCSRAGQAGREFAAVDCQTN